MKANYHTHTERCNHARGSDEQFVQAAIEAGYEELGFSDHSPWNYTDKKFVPQIRMPLKEFEDYYESISSLKEKYKNQISIKIGLECEYFPRYLSWLKDFVKEKNIDYIILGNHYDGSDEDGVYYGWSCDEDAILEKYTKDIEEAVHTGMYSYLAHPDLFMRARKEFDALATDCSYRICRACKQANMPLEYNLEGMRVNKRKNEIQYPHPSFWKIAAEVGNDVIIGNDAHYYKSLNDGCYEQAIQELEALGLHRVEMITYRW